MTPNEKVLGVEGGGTKTAWLFLEGERILASGKLPPSNLRLTAPDQLRAMFAELPRDADRIGVFLAGCVTDDDRAALAKICRDIWPDQFVVTGSDRDSGLAAALQDRDGIAVNAGTGSSVTGRRGDRIEKAGGWGHVLGDVGGGYYLSLQALRLLLREYDLDRGARDLAAEILRALCLNNFDELVRWAQAADKMEIATLTPVVFAAAERDDPHVREILQNGARALAEYVNAVAARLALTSPDVRLLGSLFGCCEVYRGFFETELLRLVANARIEMAPHSPEWGAAWLASGGTMNLTSGAISAADVSSAATEQKSAVSAQLDRLTSAQIVELFVNEESAVQQALHERAAELATAIDRVAAALQKGGRLFYIGAGTSGRLGVLDASEIPPTFGASPELVQGIIAGGAAALRRSVEGAEDETAAGALAVRVRKITGGDVICGITASGRTPFVLGALQRAKEFGATTILLTCNPAAARCASADLQIDLPTGAEIITGSTRLKAGTATKVALNIISSGAMIRLGKVRGNLMIDVAATNSKLRDRAARIVADLTNCSYDIAVERLTAANWNVREVVARYG